MVSPVIIESNDDVVRVFVMREVVPEKKEVFFSFFFNDTILPKECLGVHLFQLAFFDYDFRYGTLQRVACLRHDILECRVQSQLLLFRLLEYL